jgi:hypothetical protein
MTIGAITGASATAHLTHATGMQFAAGTRGQVPMDGASGGTSAVAAARMAARTHVNLNDYYGAAQGKVGAALLHSLHLITRNGHIDSGYAQARDGMFGIVRDLHNNDQVEDIYTGRMVRNVSDRKTAYDRGLNAEHTWPQSLGATGIGQSDLHQLMPSDIDINAKRGNLPYGEVRDAEWESQGSGPDVNRLGTDASGRRVFEPRASIRGDIARGLLYFFVRYNQSRPSGFSLQNFRHELPTLLKWAQADPVSDAERFQNDAIHRIQGNRNPFVDHPEMIQPAFEGLQL